MQSGKVGQPGLPRRGGLEATALQVNCHGAVQRAHGAAAGRALVQRVVARRPAAFADFHALPNAQHHPGKEAVDKEAHGDLLQRGHPLGCPVIDESCECFITPQTSIGYQRLTTTH